MEAGNRCFDERVPEEINRKIVDHISDINLPYSDIAREYLLNEGIPADRIIKTGSPMNEVLMSKMEEIKKSDILKKLSISSGGYFLVSAHREENIDNDNNFSCLIESINAIADNYKCPIIFSTHPRTMKKIKNSNVILNPLIHLLKPFGYIDYIFLQINAKAILSDSGSISEETSILGLKALNIREAHERPEAMEEGTAMMVGVKKDRIMQGLSILENEFVRPDVVRDYTMNNVSDKVLKIIISYTDYVNRTVWKKYE